MVMDLIRLAFWVYTAGAVAWLAVGMVRAMRRTALLRSSYEELVVLQEHFRHNVPNQWIFYDGQGW